jgi:UDP-N-acetylglucosamine--N-acetylmuramyl-(pentapeptide) pyrophosphoryl-undecaprenol N-acetylglucosamine transferase
MASEVHPFYSAMDELFQRVDLAVTRAGANTLFELALFGIPALVVPYPHAGGHQKYNAQAFAEKGGLALHDEDAGVKDWLTAELRKAVEDPGSLAGMANAMKKIAKPRATDELIEIARRMIEAHEDRT